MRRDTNVLFAAVRRDRIGQSRTHQPAWPEVPVLSGTVSRGRDGPAPKGLPALARCALCRMSTARTEWLTCASTRRNVCGTRAGGLPSCCSQRSRARPSARRRPPVEPRRRSAYACRARAREGRYDEAERLYASSLARRRRRRGAREARGHLLSGGKVRRGDPELRRALALKPGCRISTRCSRCHSRSWGSTPGSAGSQARLRAWTAIAPSACAWSAFTCSARIWASGGTRTPWASHSNLSRRYPDDPEVLYHTGRLFSNYAYLQTMKLQRVAPDSVWMHQAAGEANESQGLWDAAIREYEQRLRGRPNRPERISGSDVCCWRSRSSQARMRSGSDAGAAAIRAGVAARPDQRECGVRARRAAATGRRARTSGRVIRRSRTFRSRFRRMRSSDSDAR